MSNRAEYAFVLAALLGPILHAEHLSNPATAAALVRAVRESENWIHDVNSFYVRLESIWTKTPQGIAARRAELKQQFPDAVLEYDTRYGAKGLMFRWHIGVDARLLRGIGHVRNGRLTLQHWLDDYHEITPGCWFPMVQGYAFYDPDESGRMYLRSRRDMRIVEIRVNEPLPDAIFHIDLKEGVEVQDHRGSEFRRYIYVPQPPSLIGKPIGDSNDIALDCQSDELHGKAMLICFCDTNQRPSRHWLRQLAEKAAYLGEQGIGVLIIQAEPADQPIVNEHESFAVARIRNHHKQVRFDWGVRSLPWLILTDRNHVVRAEGFAVSELEGKLDTLKGKVRS